MMDLMTYREWRQKNPDFFLDIPNLDEATIRALDDWFGYRLICDNEKFATFYRREINLNLWQYQQLLRLESVTFDPMVSSYVERWVNRKGTSTDSRTGSETGDSSSTSNGTTNGTTNSTPGVTEKRISTETRDTTQTTDNTSTETPNTTVKATGSSSGTSNSNQTATDSKEGTDSGTSNKVHHGNNDSYSMELNGVLADSSSYGSSGASSMYGLPDELDYTYTDSQRGSQGKGISESTDTDTTSGTSKVKGSSTTEDSTNSSTESDSTTITTGTNVTTNGGTVKDTGTVTHEDTMSRTGTDKQVSSGEHSDTTAATNKVDRTDSGESSFDHTDKEIATGRSQSPQEMLDRARTYFLKMNAFDWLRKCLDICFMSVYDM